MEAQNRIRRNRRTGLVLGVLLGLTLAFIWGNSLQSGAASGAMSGSLRAWLEQLLHVPVDEFLLRKAAHFSEYALLGAELSLLLNLLLDRDGRPLARGRRLLDFPALGFLPPPSMRRSRSSAGAARPCSTSGSTPPAA